jgi:hypothetical protein
MYFRAPVPPYAAAGTFQFESRPLHELAWTEATAALVFYAMTPRNLSGGYQPPKRQFPTVRLHELTMSVFSPATAPCSS